MVATWTRGVPCAPHDHHESRSAIRILQGRSHHRMFQCREGQLVESLLSEKRQVMFYSILKQIHAMGDDETEDAVGNLTCLCWIN